MIWLKKACQTLINFQFPVLISILHCDNGGQRPQANERVSADSISPDRHEAETRVLMQVTA